jgi:hypothetical protein
MHTQEYGDCSGPLGACGGVRCLIAPHNYMLGWADSIAALDAGVRVGVGVGVGVRRGGGFLPDRETKYRANTQPVGASTHDCKMHHQ